MVATVARIVSCVALGALVALFCAAGVSAHPLGNFTINHLAVIRSDGRNLRVHYVLDIAEIPTFQIMHAAGSWTPAQMQDWQGEEGARIADAFSLRADGAALPMHVERTSARTRPGAGGLPTLYWTGDYSAPMPVRAAVSARDRVYADRRIGWKDIVLPGVTDPTNALRSYPSALIGSPRHNDEATFDVRGARITHVRIGGEDSAGWSVASMVRTSALTDLFSRNEQTPLLVLLTILAAFGLGALHGLEPGHGKALLAFTLVGSRATFKQALILAGALTFAHTIAVLALGVLLFVAAGFATESLFTWITLLSGAAVVAIGARSLSLAVGRVVREREHAHAHDSGLAHHHRHDEHARDAHARHQQGHSHAIPGSKPLQFRSAVVAAMSGGVAPCPAAIVVLLTALHLHRVGYGLLLIVVFSLGLAAILSGLGLAVVHGAAWLQRRSAFAGMAKFAPFVTSCVISIIGAIMLSQGVVEQGVRISGLGVVVITLLGIGMFAFIPLALPTRSTHRALIIKEPT